MCSPFAIFGWLVFLYSSIFMFIYSSFSYLSICLFVVSLLCTLFREPRDTLSRNLHVLNSWISLQLNVSVFLLNLKSIFLQRATLMPFFLAGLTLSQKAMSWAFKTGSVELSVLSPSLSVSWSSSLSLSSFSFEKVKTIEDISSLKVLSEHVLFLRELNKKKLLLMVSSFCLEVVKTSRGSDVQSRGKRVKAGWV